MVAERITVGVHALDRVILPRPAGARGWTARLAEAMPVLAPGAVPVEVWLTAGPEGLMLDKDAGPARAWRAGAAVAVEPVEGRPGLFLVRIGGRAAGLATARTWRPGQEPLLHGAARPEVLAAVAAEALIDTPDGPRPAGTLVAGDVVTTLGNGSRPLRWVGRRRVEPVEMLACPGLRPVVFEPGAMGNARALSVSPRKRVLIDDWRAAVYFGEDRVFVAAQTLVDNASARVRLPSDGMDYVILLCDRHEVLLAEGALVESFHPGEIGLDGLPRDLRAELAAQVPEAELTRRRAAFPIVQNAEARALRIV